MRAHVDRVMRALLVACAALFIVQLVGACKREARARCTRCGMVLQSESTWLAEIERPGGKREQFDTPKCALKGWVELTQSAGYKLRVTEYYSGKLVDANEVRFAIGSDVRGPMGADFVPVARHKVGEFEKEHHATTMIDLSAIDAKAFEAVE